MTVKIYKRPEERKELRSEIGKENVDLILHTFVDIAT